LVVQAGFSTDQRPIDQVHDSSPTQQPDLSHNTTTQHQSECVPLSAIVQIPKLPTYSGDILEFKAFWGQFDGAVHRRKDFDNVTKFGHLKSCLSGQALQLANGLIVTAENYEELVKLLHDLFHRTTDILDAHINRLHEFQPASSHSRKSCYRYTTKSAANCWRYVHLEETLTHVTPSSYLAVAQASQLAAAFLYFLSQRALCMDHTDNLANRKTRSPPARQNIRRQIRKHTTIDPLHPSITPKCPLCRGDHRLPNCKQFLSQGLEERKKTARTLQLCFKSLQHGHRATDCKLKGRGWILHCLLTSPSPIQHTRRQADPDNEKQPTQKKSLLEEKTDASANVLLTSTHGPTRIRFQTKRAIAHGAEGKQMTVNCLFDSAAERTLVREYVAQTLRLAGPIETITVKEVHGIHCHSTASRRIQLRLNDIPSVPFLSKDWKHLEQLHLPEERDMNLPIHILIGLDFYCRFLGENILQGGHNDLVAIETTLGWVLFGPVNSSPNTIS
ncbi:hypothetical protein T07_4786, partial [Trichinella nelsoni]